MYTFTGKTVITLAGLAVVAFGVYWYEDEIKGYPPPWQQACTMEAMQCPDGSWVGRTGPHCEFICPTASSTVDGSSTSTGSGSSGGDIAPYRSGIRGTVMAGPTCPVERTPPDPACADRPLQTNVSIFRRTDPTRVIATVRSSAQGAFQVSLPPGDYVVDAGNSQVILPRCTPTSATVGAVGYTPIVISCDTGIR